MTCDSNCYYKYIKSGAGAPLLAVENPGIVKGARPLTLIRL